jgi:hypothetical protein
MPFVRSLSAGVWLAFWSSFAAIALLMTGEAFGTISGIICASAGVWYMTLAILTRKDHSRAVSVMLGPTLALTTLLTLAMLVFATASVVGLFLAAIFLVGLPLFGLDYWDSARRE